MLVCRGFHPAWLQWVCPSNLMLTCPWTKQWISISSQSDLWPPSPSYFLFSVVHSSLFSFIPLQTFGHFQHSLIYPSLLSLHPHFLFWKSARVCQSHFKSVSCFNLLNLFVFFSVAAPPLLLSFLLPPPCWVCAHVMWPTMSSFLFCLISHLSLSFDVSIPPSLPPSPSVPPSHLSLLPLSLEHKSEKGLFLFSHLRQSIKEARGQE